MRKIRPVEPDWDEWKAWIRECEVAAADLLSKAVAGENFTISDLYKPREIKDRYFLSRDAPFFGKCAYCDAYIKDFQYGDIDHFRPKGAVTDEVDRPIPDHPGYYWLAYDWKNLLPTCITCNRPSTCTVRNRDTGQFEEHKIGKHMRFPVRGKHATTPNEVADEEPLLLNPLVDDPDDHLEVNLDDGFLVHKSDRGKMCVDVFGLNIRDQLPESRLEAMDRMRFQLLRNLKNNPVIARAMNGELSHHIARMAVLAPKPAP